MRHLVLLSLVGCGPASLHGTIDGERVGGARDAFYDTVGVDLGPLGEYELLVVMLTDFADGCEVIEAFAEANEPSCEERCEEILGISEDFRLGGDRFWGTTFSVNTSDGIDGRFEHDGDLGEGEFTSSFSLWDGEPLRDADACEDACEDGELLVADVENGEDGELELEQDGDVIVGRFDVSYGGDEGMKGSFVAQPCDMGEWLELF